MEPLLSHSKGAELYDMRRNSHYNILHAPEITASDPNVQRAQDASLTPTSLSPTLGLQASPEYPLSGILNVALAEAGKLNLQTLLQTNSGTLTSTLTNLSQVAAEMAKASAKLTGDAQEQVLASAGEVAKQIGSIVEKSLNTPATTYQPLAARPPQTPEDKAVVAREITRIDKGPGTPLQKRERKAAIGSPAPDPDTMEYRVAIQFLDHQGEIYQDSTFRLAIRPLADRETTPINAGQPLELDRGTFYFEDSLTFRRGGRITLFIDARIRGIEISANAHLTLPAHPPAEVLIIAQIKSTTRTVKDVSAKSAMEQAVTKHTASAEIKAMLEQHVEGKASFPIEIAKIELGGGTKTQLDVRALYSGELGETESSTESSSKEETYEVRLPLLGWQVELAK